MKKYLSFSFVIFLFLFGCEGDSDSASPSSGNESTTGTGGSLARFTIAGDFLYAVDQRNLITFSIEDLMQPRKVDVFDLEWGVETIFNMDSILFIGTQTGMHMFDVTNGSRPGYLSGYEHIQSCDPVVAQDTLAFVTLRDGSGCRNGENLLEVLDIRDVKNPKLIESHDMKNPHGLGVDGKYLFVTEGQFGLKVFEIGKGGILTEIKHYTSIRSKDVIIGKNKVLIVMADDGIFQYDYSDIQNLTLLSDISIAL